MNVLRFYFKNGATFAMLENFDVILYNRSGLGPCLNLQWTPQ
jgi:hypothetical protein